MIGTAERASWRSRYLALQTAPPRSELAAGAAVAALLAQLLFAQLTLALAICLMLIGRVGRWRPLWLAVPAVAGLAWMLTTGVRPAVYGYLIGGGRVITSLTGPGSALARLGHLPDAFRRWQQWLPRQLPLALLAASAQTAGLTVLRRAGQLRSGRLPHSTGPRRCRPGLIVAARRRYLVATTSRGEVATSDGGCVGIADGTGRRAAISWREAESGVLCAGQDAAAVAATGLELATAAIQHRKTVIVIDLASRAGRLADPIAQACAAAGAPLRCFGDLAGCYDPAWGADPARSAALILAALDWNGVSHAQQRFCADYLNAVLAVIAATPGGPARQPVAVLDELADLLHPEALRARLRLLPGYLPGHLPGPDALTGQVVDLAGQLEVSPALVAPVASQLTGLRSAALGHWLGPARSPGPARPANVTASGQAPISLGRALVDRQVVLFPLDRSVHGRAGVTIARLAAADLIATLTEAAAQARSGDCLTWINGCEALDPRQLTALLALGSATGTAVLLSTAAERAAVRLAGEVNVIVVRGPAPPALARLLGTGDLVGPAHDPPTAGPPGWVTGQQPGQITADAITASEPGQLPRISFRTEDSTRWMADTLLGQQPDALGVLVRNPRPRLLLGCRAVR